MPIILSGEMEGLIQVASTFRQRDLVLGRLRWILYIGGATAVAVAGLITAALAGRALRPVAEMTETADAIALARGFDQRLQGDRRRDELGRLARTFNNMLQSLETAYSAQQRFTADASHELRAPLTAIRGNLDVLARIENMPDEEQGKVLDLVRSEVERLSRLANDLLSLARADAGQTLHLEPVELDTVLIEAHQEGLILSEGQSVAIDSIVPVVVIGDRDRLKELIIILLDNAIKYTAGDGTVSLNLSAAGPWATIAVTDNGIGIDEVDIPHVFDRFWRADPARSKDSGGTGLGLAIARWIVDRHGGEIRVKSQESKGTQITVRIPVER
jgi:signal transduction histidine kinase